MPIVRVCFLGSGAIIKIELVTVIFLALLVSLNIANVGVLDQPHLPMDQDN